MSEANFQISEKLTDTAIFVVRGEDYVDFSNNIEAVASDKDFREDMNKFIEQVTGRGIVSMQQAQQNVQQAFPQAQPVGQNSYQQAPSGNTSGQTNGAPTCMHGPREFREGRNKKGGTWQGLFCPQKSKNCGVMNPDGTMWN